MENLSEKLPKKYTDRMKKQLGNDFEKYLSSLNENYIRGIRVNTEKVSIEKFEEIFDNSIEKLSFSNDGYILNSNEKLGNSPLHLAGLFYHQEPSSMLSVVASGIEKENRPLKVLDLCASPGGKSGQIACRISNDSMLVSNEIIKSRADVLYSNIERQGFKNVVITNTEPKDLLCFENYFDYVFVDAPCSGEGMFRKTPETIGEWSVENVKMCAERQKEILEVAEKLVAAGGKLVYSTCTFAPDEDEKIVKWFIETFNFELENIPEEIKAVTVSGNLDGTTQENMRKFYPFVSKGEGQFVAVLKNTEEDRKDSLHARKHSKSIYNAGRSHLKLFEEFEDQTFDERIKGRFVEVGTNLYLVPECFDAKVQTALEDLKFISIGTKMGGIQKDRFEPNHSLFVSFADKFRNKIELEAEELKKYLHGEEISKNIGIKGYAVVTHKGFSIGGTKVSGGKLKNLYPKGLRI